MPSLCYIALLWLYILDINRFIIAIIQTFVGKKSIFQTPPPKQANSKFWSVKMTKTKKKLKRQCVRVPILDKKEISFYFHTSFVVPQKGL